jgi:hypothetical protein
MASVKRFSSSHMWALSAFVLVMAAGFGLWWTWWRWCSPAAIEGSAQGRGHGGLPEPPACPRGKVCLDPDEYDGLVKNASTKPTSVQTVQVRDRRVLQDPLYPPLNRTDAGTYQDTMNSFRQRDAILVNPSRDTYRLVGYYVNKDEKKDAGGNVWKVFAREKDRNGNADFYMSPANNQVDMKIKVDDNMMPAQRLKNIDNIPDRMTFKSPMLLDTPYEFMELPKSDLTAMVYT